MCAEPLGRWPWSLTSLPQLARLGGSWWTLIDQTRLGSSRSLNPGLILFAGLSQAQSGTPTVLVDEFDAGPFKSSSYDIKGSATRATRPCLQLMHSYDSNSGFICQVLLAPTEKSSGCPGLLRCNHAGRSCRKRVIPTIP